MEIVKHGLVDSPSYQFWKYDITFYADGTYVSKHEDYVTGEEMINNGNYAIIHDGRTLEMGVTIVFYWDFEFLSDDIMLVTTDNSQLLYIAQ